MAHFAQLNADNEVTQIVVVANAVLDDNGTESEALGIAHLQALYGADTTWKQCSYNGKQRGVYPSKGFTYSSTLDKFIRPRPHNSWTLNSDGDWQAPVAFPTDGERHLWDEDNQQWIDWSE